MVKATNPREAYLKDYHLRLTGATRRLMGELPVEIDGSKYESSYHVLAGQIPPTEHRLSVLDVACGDGYLLGLLAQRKQLNLELCGLDFSEAELTDAQSRLRGTARLIDARAQDLPLPDASFDYVLSHMALMLMDELDLVIEELHRVLRPGGHFCAIVQRQRQGKDRDAILPIILEALERLKLNESIPLGDPRMTTPAGISAALEKKFERLSLVDFEITRRLDLQAYWRDLTTRYSIEALPETERIVVRERVLGALAHLLESDGKVSTGLGLRLLTAVAKG